MYVLIEIINFLIKFCNRTGIKSTINHEYFYLTACTIIHLYLL